MNRQRTLKKKDFSHTNQPEKESMPSKFHPGTCLLHVYSNKNLNKERLKWGLYKKCWLNFEKFMCFNLYIRNSFERFEVTDLRLKMFALFNSQLCLGWRESRRLSGPPSGTTRSMMLTRRWGTGLISGKNRNLKMRKKNREYILLKTYFPIN